MIQPPPVAGIGNAGGVPHDGRGSRRPRLAGTAGSDHRDGEQGRADAGADAGVHPVRELDAADLSRHRPHQGAAARDQRARRVRRAAGLYRLGLRQRLQPVRTHVPRHRPGRCALSSRSEGYLEDPRAQFERRDRAARLVHDDPRHRRPVPGAALQPLSGGRARRRRGAGLLAGPGDRAHGARSPPRPCPTASATSGRRSPSSRSGPATPRCSPSCSPWYSSSWCWRRSSKA